jgi:hypothetical protein
VETITPFDAGRFDSTYIQQHARQFDIRLFRQQMTAVIVSSQIGQNLPNHAVRLNV